MEIHDKNVSNTSASDVPEKKVSCSGKTQAVIVFNIMVIT